VYLSVVRRMQYNEVRSLRNVARNQRAMIMDLESNDRGRGDGLVMDRC
jgi:hypothetical protein